MIGRCILSLALLCMPLASAAQPFLAGFNDDQITWHALNTGLEKAKAEGKPVFLLVHATWCPTCRAYRRSFFDPQVVALANDAVFVLIDRDQEPDLSKMYAPDGNYIPRSMILESDGNLRTDLTSGRDDFRFFLQTESARPLTAFLKAALR